MTSRTHDAIAFASLVTVAAFVPIPQMNVLSIICVIVACDIGALIPDMDTAGNRLWELLQHSPMEVFVLNTGRVGGDEKVSGSKKVKIPHSSAVVKAIAEGTIQWTKDADFGYEVATLVPDFPKEDLDILQPRRLYEAQGRMDEYRQLVKKIKEDRVAYMAKWKGLRQEIVDAVR